MKILIACLGLLPTIVFGQLSREVDTPVSKLPATISAPADRVSLIADFSSAKPGSPIRVFLVNNSEHDLKLCAQDGDVYLKLETLTESGEWVRAEAHAFSWCGNSYTFTPSVRTGHFMKIDGYQPPKGRKAKVRFRIYEQNGLDLATQVGDGICLESDIAKASSDALAVSSGSFGFVVSVARGEKKLKNTSDHIRDLQWYAIYQLGSGRFPAEKVLPILEEIDTKFPKYREDVNYVRSQVTTRE